MPRIIAGRFGGRTLTAPHGRSTRPTSDRVREALFSRLNHELDLDGARVLDLFAGAGTLGLEALSRGADEVVLVDSGRGAANACRANVAALDASSKVRVINAPVASYLGQEGSQRDVDLVFIDPPYDLSEQSLANLLVLLMPWLTERAVVVVERSARSPEPTWGELTRFDQRDYGETRLWFAEPSEALLS